MARKHYHVLSGLTGGYLPNTNDVYTSRKAAQSGAAWLAASYRDTEAYVFAEVTGSAKAGWYDVGRNEYIAITECVEEDCLEGGQD